jgi:predicted TIM-barrel fold metal-dependent hydrolase
VSSIVISADSHVVEPHDLWQQRIEPEYRERAPKLVSEPDTDRLVFGEAELPPVGLLAGCARGDDDVRLKGRWDEDVFPGGYDPKIRLDDLAKDGVDGEVLFPTIAMQLYRVKDFEFRSALFRAYNTWLSEFVGADHMTFKGAGMLTEEDPGAAVHELLRCKEIGLDAVMLPQVPGDEVSYSDAKFDSLWAAAVECGFPVNFHAATTRDEKRAWNAGTPTDGVLASYEVQRVILDMILFGTFDKFPELRIVSVENEAGWAAQMIERADFVWRRSLRLKRQTAMVCQEPPSHYLHKNVRITFMRDRAAVLTESIIGEQTLMWGNDFPHHVSTWPHSREVLAECFEGQSDEARQRIVAGNAIELYGFELSA